MSAVCLCTLHSIQYNSMPEKLLKVPESHCGRVWWLKPQLKRSETPMYDKLATKMDHYELLGRPCGHRSIHFVGASLQLAGASTMCRQGIANTWSMRCLNHRQFRLCELNIHTKTMLIEALGTPQPCGLFYCQQQLQHHVGSLHKTLTSMINHELPSTSHVVSNKHQSNSPSFMEMNGATTSKIFSVRTAMYMLFWKMAPYSWQPSRPSLPDPLSIPQKCTTPQTSSKVPYSLSKYGSKLRRSWPWLSSCLIEIPKMYRSQYLPLILKSLTGCWVVA